MRFEYPKLLWFLLLVVPGLIAFFWWSGRQRKRLMDQFVNPRLLEQLLSGISPQFQKVRAAMLIVSAALFVIAFARPQFGFDWEEVRQRGLDIVVAIDTSRSMLAEDVSPNRLARAKLAALDLRKIAKADRMGLVAFAGTAFLQCPLSSDDEAFRQSINELNVNIIPQGGTALADAINAARSAFKDKSDNHKVLVLFTDGEDHDGQALDVAKEAAKEGLRIFTIGVGSDEGELLRITDARGRSDFIKDAEGNVVKSRLDKALLMGIAKTTEGFFLLLGGADTMDILYQRGLAPLPKAELASRQIQRYHERFQWVILSAIILLIAEMFVPERKRMVRSERPERRLQPAAARVVALLLAFLVPHSVSAASASKALKEYNAGKYERALHHFQDLLRDKPNDPRLNFNAGDAAFKWEMYEPALKHFNSALATEDLQLQQRAFYNLGNTHFRLGEQEKDQSKTKSNWEDAITSYESALKLNPNDTDAKFNLELVKKKLEELKQQQQKDNQKQDKSDDQKDKKDQQKQDKKDDQQQQQQQNKQDEQKKQEQQEQQQQQAQKPDEKKDDQQQQQQSQSKPGNEDKKDQQEEQQGDPLKKIQMTPQQAIRLLEAAKNDERTLIFIPPQKTNRTDRAFKDW